MVEISKCCKIVVRASKLRIGETSTTIPWATLKCQQE